MRKVVYGGACSLDGFLAREDGSVDWLMFSDEAAEIIKDSWSRFDTMLMGRKTFEVAMQSAQKQGKGSKSDNPYGMETYVFSTTMDPGQHPNINIIEKDAGEFVRSLKQKEGKDICLMGGGSLARSLFDDGVIDEVGFNIHPIILGSGVPSFHRMESSIPLERIEFRPLENGCVYVRYAVRR